MSETHRGFPPTPALTVDIIIQTEGGVVLIKRQKPPYQEKWCLPGGFVDIGETVEEAAKREAKEETGLEVRIERLVGVFSDPTRDPRGHTASCCFLATVIGGTLKGDDDALDAKVFRSIADDQLGFDHAEMCAEAGVLLHREAGYSDHD